MALQISTGAGKHACIEGATALGGLEAHVGDLGAISTRINIRVEIAPRSPTCFEAT